MWLLQQLDPASSGTGPVPGVALDIALRLGAPWGDTARRSVQDSGVDRARIPGGATRCSNQAAAAAGHAHHRNPLTHLWLLSNIRSLHSDCDHTEVIWFLLPNMLVPNTTAHSYLHFGLWNNCYENELVQPHWNYFFIASSRWLLEACKSLNLIR